MGAVPFVRQSSRVDCGAAALAMVLTHWGRPTTIEDVVVVHRPDPRRGIVAGSLRNLARARGLSAFLVAGTPEDLSTEIGLGRPVLVGLVKRRGREAFGHYAVVVGLRRDGSRILLLDPGEGSREESLAAFLLEWSAAGHLTLVVLGERTRASP